MKKNMQLKQPAAQKPGKERVPVGGTKPEGAGTAGTAGKTGTDKTKKPEGRKVGKAKRRGNLFSLRNKIVLSFLVPFGFMIVIGISAYQKSSEGLITSFKDSTMQTIHMAEEYVDMAFSLVESEAIKYAFDNDLGKYFIGLYNSDPAAKTKLVNNTKTQIGMAKASNAFISDIHILTNKGINMISTFAGSATDGILGEYRQSPAGSNIKMEHWIDDHAYIDEAFTLDQSTYILSYQLMSSANVGCVIVDVDAANLSSFLQQLDLGEGSIIGFVTKGGREIIYENTGENGESLLSEGEQVFFGQPFYMDFTAPGEAPGAEPGAEAAAEELPRAGAEEVTFKGESYFFIYNVNDRTGGAICALVPMKLITAQAGEIGSLTVGLVILACIIVLVVGVLIVAGIQNNMKRISRSFGVVAQGNLTTRVVAKGRDEFRDLADSANNMIGNTKKLVQKVADATGQLEESARAVETVSGVISDYSTDITQAINEINEGMSKQSEHAQECVSKTDTLSSEILEVSRVVEDVEKLVEETESMIDRGMEIVRVLGDRASETNDITKKVGESIVSLRQESEIINTFVRTITEISEQTNLLSLNASIEAARAGEAGRGFAVVAEEIRKLADDSATAAGEIRNNVEHITAQTQNSVESAQAARDMVAAQTEAVEQVVDVFQEMQQRMRQLVDGLKNIVDSTEKADRERSLTVDAVKNISDIIEETANSAEVVREVVDKLMEKVENLNHTADMLGENMDGLKTEISVFKV